MVMQDFQCACEALHGGELLRWEWDDRFRAALAAVKSPHHTEVLALLAAHLPTVWDHQSIRQASGPVVQLSRDWGGLRPGQLMYTLDPADDPLLFGVWWPWGGNTTFSLRVGCVVVSDAAGALEPLATLRRLLDVA